MQSEENLKKEHSQEIDTTNYIAKTSEEVKGATHVEEDMDMDGDEDTLPKKSSGKNAKVPLHLLSQRKLRKLQSKQKQKKLKKTKKFLKWWSSDCFKDLQLKEEVFHFSKAFVWKIQNENDFSIREISSIEFNCWGSQDNFEFLPAPNTLHI